MKKIIFLVIFLVLTIVLAIGFVIASKPDKLTEAEKEKAISEVVGRKANLNPELKTGGTTYNGKYASFSYPASARIYTYRSENIKINKSILESFSIDLQSPRRVLNYSVASQEPNVKLDDLSAVRFRVDSTNGYSKKQVKVNGEEGLVFSKDRSGEFMAESTAFVLRNGNLYTFSFTASTLPDAEKLNKEILDTVVFNK